MQNLQDTGRTGKKELRKKKKKKKEREKEKSKERKQEKKIGGCSCSFSFSFPPRLCSTVRYKIVVESEVFGNSQPAIGRVIFWLLTPVAKQMLVTTATQLSLRLHNSIQLWANRRREKQKKKLVSTNTMPASLPRPVIIQHARCLRQRLMSIPTTSSIVSTRRRFETASPMALNMSHQDPETSRPATRLRFLPRILQADMLRSYFSPFLRRSRVPPGLQKQKEKNKEWNPYTFFIITFLVIGSQAINLIALKHEHKDFMRRTESKIDLLREVIERIEKGEDVNVEKLLGTGVESEEKIWEECELLGDSREDSYANYFAGWC